MANTNDFQALALDPGAYVATQAAFLANATLLADGFASGKVPGDMFNKAFRQSSVMAKMLGDFINSIGALDALDDGDTATLLANFVSSVRNAGGNYAAATQLPLGATSNITAQEAGGYFQCQGGTVNLPASAGMRPGSTFAFSTSAATSIVPNGADRILVGGVSNTSLALGTSDFAVLVLLGTGAWEVISGSSSSVLGSASSFAASLAANGYQKLPSGLIIQWGSFNGAGSGATTTVTFPIAFPNNRFTVSAIGAAANNVMGSVWRDSAPSPNPLTQFAFATNTLSNIVFWIAVGN